MKTITGCPRLVLVCCLLAGGIFCLTRCISHQNNENKTGKIPEREDFAGSASCGNCHRDLYQSHVQTAHFRTSAPASASTVKGSFDTGHNQFYYDTEDWVAMKTEGGARYQVAYHNGTVTQARRFDMVFGSGAKGQTSAFWNGDHLFQLPITYFTAAAAWSNSPGYPMKPVYNRPITSRCMECHSTFVQTTGADNEEPQSFRKESIIYGIDCEKCHGPGAAHVRFQQANPTARQAAYILNPARMSRQQQLDACALCHGGRLQKTAPSFSFRTGDTLSHFFHVDSIAPDPAGIDLHGNQYGLLRSSKCFLGSETMTCSTCHDSHRNERGTLAVFSQRCLSCHTRDQHQPGMVCKLAGQKNLKIDNNCIDCHMPASPSRAISVFLPGADIPVSAFIRTHYIRIYPGATKKFIAAKQSGQP
jgi:hypothetical protein